MKTKLIKPGLTLGFESGGWPTARFDGDHGKPIQLSWREARKVMREIQKWLVAEELLDA